MDVQCMDTAIFWHFRQKTENQVDFLHRKSSVHLAFLFCSDIVIACTRSRVLFSCGRGGMINILHRNIR